jgi:hypothetical protein
VSNGSIAAASSRIALRTRHPRRLIPRGPEQATGITLREGWRLGMASRRQRVTPREYKLFLTRPQKFTVALPVIMFVLFPVLFLGIVGSQDFPAEDAPPFFPWFPFAFFLLFAAFYLLRILTLPYRITVTRDAQLLFKSVLRSQSVRARDVLSIEPRQINLQAGVSGYLLKHREGKVRFPGQFTDQYRLLYELKEANPSVELKGC